MPAPALPILVAVDGSRASDAAIRYAAHEAQRLGVGICLAHVVPSYVPMAPMLPLLPPDDLAEISRRVLTESQRQAEKLLDQALVETVLLDGPRIPALMKAAEEARMVVVGHERHAAVRRLVTGSTLAGVAAHATTPVVAVPPEWDAPASPARVVVGIKDPAHSHALVRNALEVAQARGAGLTLVHAWELPSGYDDLIVDRIGVEEWRVRATAEIDDAVADATEAMREGTPEVDVVVVHGQPAQVLRDASASAGLMVIARRRHAFPVGHLGGTARALLRESLAPVMVLPPAED